MTFWEISEFHKLKEGLSATGCKSEEGRKSISMWDLILALRISSCISLGKLLHLSVLSLLHPQNECNDYSISSGWLENYVY